MKKLKINWPDLRMAFDETLDGWELTDECCRYLDLETGRVVFVGEAIRESFDAIVAELEEQSDADRFEIEALSDIQRTAAFLRLSEGEQADVVAMFQVLYQDEGRFVVIKQDDSTTSRQTMKAFIDTIQDEEARDRLQAAIHQRNPLRRFNQVIHEDRRLQWEWQVFEHAQQLEAMIQWLASVGVEPLNPDEGRLVPPPLPDLRKIMFAETRRFVRVARELPGVRRIALIGSLTTNKEFPKDIDLLVTVEDHCDLSALARLARQLSGRMSSHSAGSDVFFANTSGEYLGRSCLKKLCGPGYRARCDAEHCGRRPYLHDDLSIIDLPQHVIAQPAVILWPEVFISDGVPLDVAQQLIDPLSRES
ncbi:MAG: UPF0158 family protein [Pirellulaceae bacterium]